MTQSKKTATFRELFALPEYRAVYLSLLVNYVGDYLTKAAVAVLVYQESRSVLLSAAIFAVGFLPWILGGTLLSAIAERYPYRRVLIIGDLSRMIFIALLLVPHVPIPLTFLLVFAASLGQPPTQAARSAMMPQLVDRDRLPIALATNSTTGQIAQVVGYLAGAALATGINPRVALGIDVVTFAISAGLIAYGVRPRPPARSVSERTHLLQESAEGFRLVFGSPTLRAIVVTVLMVTVFAIVPEGLAAPWAAQSTSDPAARGINQGMIMAAVPVGWALGAVLIHRLVDEEGRDRLIRPLAVLSALALVPTIVGPPAPLVALFAALCGVAQGGLSPTLNAKFVLILPQGYRARAFGVVQGGMQLTQFLGVVISGWLADHYSLPLVVGFWSIGGAVVMSYLAARWPSDATFQAAIEQAAIRNAADEPPHRHAAPETEPLLEPGLEPGLEVPIAPAQADRSVTSSRVTPKMP